MTDPGGGTVSLGAVGRSALILTGGAVIVQAIGFVRQLFLAAEVGITSELDALLIALALPLALAGIIRAGVRPAMVPAYTAAKDERGAPAARRLVGTVLVWLGLAGIIGSVFLWVFADAMVALTGPGLASGGTADEATHYLRMLSPLVFHGVVVGIFMALCQAESLFPAMAVASVVEPLLALAIMILLWDSMGLDGLVIGILVGAAVNLAIIVSVTIVKHVFPSLGLDPRGLGMRGLVRHAAPLTLSAALLQAADVVGRAIASLLLPGGVSVLRFGESIVRVPFAAIRPAYGTAIYPTLVQASRDKGQAGLATTVERVLRYALVFFTPLAALTMAVAPLATAIAYDRGSFSAEDLALTSAIVAITAPLIVTWTIAPTLVSTLNARFQGTAVFAAGNVRIAASLLLTVAFGFVFGVVGVALAATVTSFLVVAYLFRRVSGIEPTLSLASLRRTALKALVAVLPAALVFGLPIWAGVLDGDLPMRVVILLIVGVVGLASYYHIANRLGLDEAGSIVAFGRDTIRRLLVRMRLGN